MAAFEELPRVRRGPLDSLYAALRRRAPQVSTARPGDDVVLPVSYRDRTAAIVWDGELNEYAWASEATGASGATGERIGQDGEKAAELVAWALGAPTIAS